MTHLSVKEKKINVFYLAVFSDASVFGDTNLESPTFVSNRSVVEVHHDIWNNTPFKQSNRTVEFFIEIPLHARYPVRFPPHLFSRLHVCLSGCYLIYDN